MCFYELKLQGIGVGHEVNVGVDRTHTLRTLASYIASTSERDGESPHAARAHSITITAAPVTFLYRVNNDD